MKFLCGSCRTKYQISDTKVRGKILTIRCKKCGAKVVVKESLTSDAGVALAPLAEERAAKPVAQEQEVRAAARGGSALASAFDVAMGGGETVDDMPTSIGPTPSNEDDAGIEWFSAVDGVQHGPFAYAELVRQIRARELSGRNYVWHDRFDAWKRVRDVDDLKAFLPVEPVKKKPPPPPPPEVERKPEPAAGGANVVDFAAERDRRQGSASARPHDPGLAGPESPTATGVEALRDSREEQLDSVLNEALGIDGEGETSRAAARNADAEALGAGVALDANAFGDAVSQKDLDPDALFDSVPRASPADEVNRESTRFFVAAAGVNAKKSRNKLGMVAGFFAFLAFAAFMGAWAAGVIEISLPGIGNPFARSKALDDHLELFADDPELSAAERKRLLEELTRQKQAGRVVSRQPRPKVRKPRNQEEPGGYVTDDERGTSGGLGPRGGTAGSIGIDGELATAGGLRKSELPVHVPTARVEVEVPDGKLDQAMIRNVVNARKKSVSICYQREIKRNSGLRGKMEFMVTVQPTGEVSRASVETPAFKGTELAGCIAEKIRGWRFPSFAGQPQKIVVPFVLEKGSY